MSYHYKQEQGTDFDELYFKTINNKTKNKKKEQFSEYLMQDHQTEEKK